MRAPHTRTRLARTLRLAALGAVLAAAALVVPNSTVATTEASLVKVERASGVDAGAETIWILAIGSDARPGEDMLRTRGDAIQMVGINTRTGAATAIGVPRDSWVPIPGSGSNRVNAALNFGGPELMGQTVGDLVGIQPDYVFVTRFPFFESLVDDIGGITVQNPRAFSDPNLKDDGFAEGRIKLNGYDAMAFSRIRKNLIGGDFDRSANQQLVLKGIGDRIRTQAGTPGFLETGILSVLKHLHTDLPPAELFRLSQAVAQVDPGKVTHCVVQGAIGSVGAASVVLPDVASARRYGDDARKDAVIDRC